MDHVQKNELLGRSACAILPFRGSESFGLVTIEAMACGTPVVALANGALAEVVEEGITGYVTDDEEDLAPLVMRATRLNRTMVRHRVAARFDLSVVADHYLALYRDIASHLPWAAYRPG
jgi:glycosyltransferase involved in cell wall biosynthesis